MSKDLLRVRDLKTVFEVDGGNLNVVNGISFSVKENECFGIIGESGCGKSLTAMSIMGYTDYIGAKVVGGSVFFEDRDLLKLKEKEWRHYRGKKIGMIMQNPVTSLNPLFTVGEQVVETIMAHRKISHKEADKQAADIFKFLGIPEDRIKSYPFQLSGGMLQRIAGGIAISGNPRLILADEPTTALDATIQLQYLDFLKKVQKEINTSIILISHDIKVIAMMCSRVAVMYAGKIIEEADIQELIEHPKHPYTEALLKTANLSAKKIEHIESIEGQPPSLLNVTDTCLFAPRCVYCSDKCQAAPPPKIEGDSGNYAVCWRLKR